MLVCKQLLADLLGGGSDTISGTLSWMFAVLLHHQDVQEKLCIEVDTFIKEHNRLPEFTDREAMPYLIAVQKECMRYRPVTHLALHSAEEDGNYEESAQYSAYIHRVLYSYFPPVLYSQRNSYHWKHICHAS